MKFSSSPFLFRQPVDATLRLVRRFGFHVGIVAAGLSIVLPAQARQTQDPTVVYTPVTVNEQNVNAPDTIVYQMTVTTPSTIPTGYSGTISLGLSLLPGPQGGYQIPTGVSVTTALGYISLSPIQLSYTGPKQVLTTTVTITLPANAQAGSYGWFVQATGWPTVDGLGNPIQVLDRGADINATVVPPPCTVSIDTPANYAVFAVAPSNFTTTVPYTIHGSTASGTTLISADMFITDNGSGLISLLDSLTTVLGLGTAGITGSGAIDLPPGSYTLSAFDSNGAGSASAESNFTVVQAGPPTVTILTPANQSNFVVPAIATTTAVSLTFEGDTNYSTILSTTATLVNSAGVAIPFTPTLSGLNTVRVTGGASVSLPAGVYTLTVTDDNGAATATSSITFTVVQSLPPVIGINTPANGATLVIPVGSTTLPVNYGITGGTPFQTIVSATANLFLNGQPLSGFSSSFNGIGTASVSDTGSMALGAGAYTISANDSNGAGFATATSTFSVVPAAAPSISIGTPSNGQTLAIPTGATSLSVPFTLAGGTSGGTVYTTITSATASLTLNGAPVAGFAPGYSTLNASTITGGGSIILGPGTYTMTVTDSNGAPLTGGGTASATKTITFTVAQAALPTIAISAPTNGSTVVIPPGSTTLAVSYLFSGGTSGGTAYNTITSASATLVNSSGTAFPISPVISGLNTAGINGSGSAVLPAGTYTLTSVDSNGAPTAAGGVASATATTTFTVAQAATPAISIVAPAASSTVTIPIGSTTVAVPMSFTGGASGGTRYTTITSASATLVNSSGTGVAIAPTWVGMNGSSITGSGSVMLVAGKYTLTAVDSNGAPSNGTATATTSFTVVQAAPPTIAITSPTNGATINIPSGSTTAQVPYTVTGGATYGTIQSASVSLNGTALSPQPAITGLFTTSISASGTMTLAAGTYTLSAVDSNGSGNATAQVTFTVGQAQSSSECLTWLNSCSSGQSNGSDNGRGDHSSGGDHSSSYDGSGDHSSTGNSGSTTSQSVTGGSVVPITFALHTCSSSGSGSGGDDHNSSDGHSGDSSSRDYGSGDDHNSGGSGCGVGICSTCGGAFVTDTSTTIAIYEVYSNGTSSTPVVYTYSATGPNPPYFSIGQDAYLLNFPTSAGSHHYVAEVYQSTGGTLHLLGSQDIYTQNSCMPSASTSGSSFNSSAIATGSTIWFNSSVNVSGLSSTAGTLLFDNSFITFMLSGKTVTLRVPSATIKFETGITSASTIYNTTTGSWVTIVPVGYRGNVFLSGLAYVAPASLPKGLNPVTWTGSFRSDTASVNARWQWAAAVYAKFTGDCNSVGVKSVDDSTLCKYKNSDHAGSPENCKSSVTAGACGSGGSNYTGSCTGPISPSIGCSAWMSLGCGQNDDGDDSGDHCGDNGSSRSSGDHSGY